MGIKYILLLFMVLYIQTTVRAQSPGRQFRDELAKATTDSQRLRLYRSISTWYADAGNDSIKPYIEQGIKDFQARGYKAGTAALLLKMSGIYTDEGMLAAGEGKAEEALKIYTELDDKNGITIAHNTLGICQAYQGNYVPAIKHFLASLKYSEQISDTAGIINSYNKLGAVNDYMGNFDKSLSYYHKALDLSLLTKESVNTVYLYNNIGSAYARKYEYDKALGYFGKALTLSRNPKYAKGHISTLTNIGKVYGEQGKHAKALEYYYKALDQAGKLKLKEERAWLLYAIGLIESIKEPGNTRALDEALQLSREMGNSPMQAEMLFGMAEIAHTNGNYKDEVSFLRQERVIHDSLFKIEKAREIANLLAEHELARTTSQLAALKLSEQKNLQQKNMIKVIAIILAVTLVTLLFFFIRVIKLNKKLSFRERDLQQANAIKDRLFSIIGHDLRGPIGNIPALLDIYKSDDTSEEEKRFILDSLEENSVASFETLEKLLNWGNLQIKGTNLNQDAFSVGEIIQQKLRLLGITADNKNVTILNKVPPGLQVYADENHFKFVLRNLLSNAVKYTRSGGIIEINAEKHTDGNYVVFSVKDNGIGIDKERQDHIFELYNKSTAGTANESGTSIGLMLCKEFIRQNGGSIWVKSEKEQGSSFYFTVLSAQPASNW